MLALEHFPGTAGLQVAPPEPPKHPGKPDQPLQCSDLQQAAKIYWKPFTTRKRHLNSVTVGKADILEEIYFRFIFFATRRTELVLLIKLLYLILNSLFI